MRATISIAVIAALAAAVPATASDRTFSKSNASLLTETYVGQPLWSLLANCAGAQGAAHGYYAEHARADLAEHSKSAGAQYLNLAIDRLVRDRGLEREAAIDVALPSVQAGRTSAAEALGKPREDQGIPWLAMKTACEEFAAGA